MPDGHVWRSRKYMYKRKSGASLVFCIANYLDITQRNMIKCCLFASITGEVGRMCGILYDKLLGYHPGKRDKVRSVSTYLRRNEKNSTRLMLLHNDNTHILTGVKLTLCLKLIAWEWSDSTTSIPMTMARESPWLWQESHHDSEKWVTMMLASGSSWFWRGMHQILEWYRPKAIFSNYSIHVLTLCITIISHILYRDNCQSHLLKVVHRGMGLFLLYYTCLLWCTSHGAIMHV